MHSPDAGRVSAAGCRPPRRLSGRCAPQIDSYERLYEEVSKCENTKVFSGWLQCDCRPFKQALLSTIKRWSFMFKRHLSNHVVSRCVPPQAPLPGQVRGRRAGSPTAGPRGRGGPGARALTRRSRCLGARRQGSLRDLEPGREA